MDIVIVEFNGSFGMGIEKGPKASYDFWLVVIVIGCKT